MSKNNHKYIKNGKHKKIISRVSTHKNSNTNRNSQNFNTMQDITDKYDYDTTQLDTNSFSLQISKNCDTISSTTNQNKEVPKDDIVPQNIDLSTQTYIDSLETQKELNSLTNTLPLDPTSQNAVLCTMINSTKKSTVKAKHKNIKTTKSTPTLKLYGKEILNNELFTTCVNEEDCKRKTKIAEILAKEAMAKAKMQKTKKSKMWSAIFLIINVAIIIAAVVISAMQEEGMVSIGKMFETANLWYLLAAFGGFILLMGFETLRYYILIWQSTKHSRPFLSYKVAAIGRYYDNITPMASGGQPMQIYYLTKRGVRASTASTMPFAIYVFNHIITFIISISVLIFSEKIAGGLSPGVKTAAVIGIIMNSSIMLFVFVLSVSKRIGPIVTIWILKLLHKMHIIKDYTALYRKAMRFVTEYQRTFRYFISNLPNFIMMIISSMGVICSRYLIPAFVVCMFSGTSLTFEIFSAVFIWCVLIEAVLSYIPWPGAGGVAEVTYTTMFAYFALSAGTTVWAMLIYRLFQYYIYLLQGLGVVCYDFFVGNKKIDKTNEKIKKIDEERKRIKYENLLKDLQKSKVNANENHLE